jgi:hypothetical protein
MRRNVGRGDRVFRAALGLGLIGTGLFVLDGLEGSPLGLVVAAASALPLYMAATTRCFVFRWLQVHSLSKRELETYGEPYGEDGR